MRSNNTHIVLYSYYLYVYLQKCTHYTSYCLTRFKQSYIILYLSDIVFFIFLYQRYIYRVDPTRVNEFGTSQEMFEQNGSAITDTDKDGNALEGPQSNGDVIKESNSDKSDTEGSEEEAIASPKSADEKKND